VFKRTANYITKIYQVLHLYPGRCSVSENLSAVKIHAAFLWATTPCSLVLECIWSETHTSPCKIWGSHSGGYEESYVLRLTPRSRLQFKRRLGGICHLHFQGWRIKQTRNHSILLPVSCWCLAWFRLCLFRWRWYVRPEFRFTFNTIHGIVS
jgi:hypothetical protein